MIGVAEDDPDGTHELAHSGNLLVACVASATHVKRILRSLRLAPSAQANVPHSCAAGLVIHAQRASERAALTWVITAC